MAHLLSTSDFLDCLRDDDLVNTLAEIRRIDDPMARAVWLDVERMIEQRLAAAASESAARTGRRRQQPQLFGGNW